MNSTDAGSVFLGGGANYQSSGNGGEVGLSGGRVYGEGATGAGGSVNIAGGPGYSGGRVFIQGGGNYNALGTRGSVYIYGGVTQVEPLLAMSFLVPNTDT